MDGRSRILFLAVVLSTFIIAAARADGPLYPVILPEQREIEYRDPSSLRRARIPETIAPRTVARPPAPELESWMLSLDDALSIALENADVIRVLTGVAATSSGRTIYDAAVTNADIDVERGRFDPTLQQNNAWNRTETPSAILDENIPGRTFIGGNRVDDYQSDLGVNKTNVLGGQLGLNYGENLGRFRGNSLFPLNPQNRDAVELNYTQPLLQGGGFHVNTAPIVIAQINTERSFFQFKDSVQDSVKGVIEAYWNLVFARTDLWARRIQLDLAQKAYEREAARKETGFGDIADVAQTRVTFNQFRAQVVAAEASVLAREAALRNILGLSPNDSKQLVPVSPPTNERLEHNWDELVALAEQRRPDIIELKLILDADDQRIIMARNEALPRVDAVGLYRWNGLEGRMPLGDEVSSRTGQFTDWTLGINFSVPLGLRRERAMLRQQELILARDRANLEQGMHFAIHDLAITVRDIDNAYEQYLAFKETREAATDNLNQQLAEYLVGNVIFLNVLQALNDWGNSVSSEAQALTSYNVALAELERKTGTILETHGVIFYEERHRAAGPLCPFKDRCYPYSVGPGNNAARYPTSSEPAENSFDLQNPVQRIRLRDTVPPPPASP